MEQQENQIAFKEFFQKSYKNNEIKFNGMKKWEEKFDRNDSKN